MKNLNSKLKTFTATLAIATSLMSFSVSAKDILLLIPQIATNMTFKSFENTKESLGSLVIREHSIFGVILELIRLPFTVLSENNNSIQVNKTELLDLGYSDEEIAQYQSDLGKISNMIQEKKSFNSKEEFINSLSELELGVVAKEQLRF